METRTVEEVKLYLLIVNGVRCSYEDCQIIGVSEELDTMRHAIESQYAEEVWIDDTFADLDGHTLRKCFKKGSKLEPFNNFSYPIHGEPQEVSRRRTGETGIFYEWVPIEQLDSIKNRFGIIN